MYCTDCEKFLEDEALSAHTKTRVAQQVLFQYFFYLRDLQGLFYENCTSSTGISLFHKGYIPSEVSCLAQQHFAWKKKKKKTQHVDARVLRLFSNFFIKHKLAFRNYSYFHCDFRKHVLFFLLMIFCCHYIVLFLFFNFLHLHINWKNPFIVRM